MKQAVKKLLSLLLVLSMLFALTACTAADVFGTVMDIAELVSEEEDSGDIQEIQHQDETEDPEQPPEEIPEEEETPGESQESSQPDEENVPEEDPGESQEHSDEPELLDEDGTYSSKEDVALYVHQYGKLPNNFVTKKEAENAGWTGGSLEPYLPGKCIGGSYFGNYEGLLPKAKGRTYTECDIDTLGARSRGAKRLVFSNDGLIYYSDDHYETFELLYGEEAK